MIYEIEYIHKVKDFKDVWEIERNYLEPSTIASVEQTISWENKNHDIHIFIRDIQNDKIVGEITLLPLSNEQFNKFMKNELEDSEINSYTLLKYKKNFSYYLLLSAIAIHPTYKDEKLVLSLLLKGLKDKLEYFSNNGIKFLNICAEGQTLDGQKFIESFLNLKFKRCTKEGYKLYSFENTEELNNWLQVFPKYIESYKKNHNL